MIYRGGTGRQWRLLDDLLSVSTENIEYTLTPLSPLAWQDFFLNPRRLRGGDFLMRWSQGVWSEKRLIEAVGATKRYFALPYGPSGTAPENDVREFELYFERLEKAGLGAVKRPDLLIFRRQDRTAVDGIVSEIGGIAELPFHAEDERRMQKLLSKAALGIECENSLWKALRMPDYRAPLTPQKRLGGRPGLRKAAVLPTVIVKEEDRVPLKEWQARQRKPIHVWHVFYDLAFGIPLIRIEELLEQGLIEPTVQTFQAPGGATTSKVIYKVYHHYAYPLGESTEDPTLVPAYIEDRNGHILPYVRFDGGRLNLTPEAIKVLDTVAEELK